MNDTSQTEMHSDDTLIASYINIRDQKKGLEEKHDKELAPLKQAMATIMDAMLARLNERGADNSKTPSGTAYKSIQTSAKVINRDEFLNYVLDNSRFNLLTNHCSKEEVEIVTQLTGEPPPGVEVSRITVVNFRRA
jgi:hypothetical protein